MNKTIVKTALLISICCLIASCSNLKRVNKPSSSRTHTTKPSGKPATERKDNNRDVDLSNNDVYAQSMKFLRKYGSSLTDYCISWVGTPYKAGGYSKNGVDCSGFVSNVYKDVYNIQLPRRSADMQQKVKILSSVNKMKEGDLVFFGKGKVNHVGIFIMGDKFIHASSSKGVIVSSLEEKYWKENFHSCGHHPQKD